MSDAAKGLDRVANGLVDGIRHLGRAFRLGWKNLPRKEWLLYGNFLALEALLFQMLNRGWLVSSLRWLLDLIYPTFFVNFCLYPFTQFSIWWQWLVGSVALVVLGVSAFGLQEFSKLVKLQKKLDCLALKNGVGKAPTVTNAEPDGPHRLKVTVLSEGVGIERYEARRADLETGLGAAIEGIRSASDLRFVELILAKRRLPNFCQFEELVPTLQTPSSFVIGESIGGTVTQSIRDLPHMLIAGTTGGGKSVFFKQALLGLLQSSPRLQIYLLDLKGGVEMKEFSVLPNVRVAKSEREAVKILRRIEREMKKRFQYLETKGYKKIDPERDKLDLIVVGVDEASVLYTKTRSKGSNKSQIEEARELTDQIAKLARAAGIHLILATQKVTKETIDTKVQENIGGRVCFRMNTIQGSLLVLGNKRAFELADIPGRGVWSVGNVFTEFQAPYISDAQIVELCKRINAEFENEQRSNFQSMLDSDVDEASTQESRSLPAA